MVPMYLGKADVNTYDKGAGREFLVSNGLGSYGFSTVIGANTRREHGLLVTRPEGAAKHSVLVSKIEETVFDRKKKYQLSTNRYKDLIYPDGYRYLQEYQGNPFPSMLFVIHGILLKKSIFMPQGETCTILKYELLASPEKIKLDLRPLFAHRSSDVLAHGADKGDFSLNAEGGLDIGVSGRGLESFCTATSGSWTMKPQLFENLVYEQDDKADGKETDCLWSPGVLTKDMSEGDVLWVVLSDKQRKFTTGQLASMEKEAAGRFEDILEKANLSALSSAEQDMIFSSYHLIDDGQSPMSPIYTGYPSVDMRARDTFVALPGLTLATGREDVAARTLKVWAERCEKQGWIMPEHMEGCGQIFESADNGLWFVYAADKYMTHMNDGAAHKDLWKAVKSITDKYMSGIRELDLACCDNGLLCLESDKPERQWMNSVAGSEVVVERKGCLVELNALWYNALKVAEKYAGVYGCAEDEAKYKAEAEKLKAAFAKLFWNKDIEGLYDWIMPDGSDKADEIRPNQILAASLPYTAIDADMAKKVIRLCWNELYTTYGLRTLNPGHEKFKGRSEGRADQRLKARFRGMAWPWLLGQFITAYIRYNPSRKDLGWIFLRPFTSHMRHGCLGGIAELFDGMMPYKPHGDVLCAMSLGEILRVLYEDLEETQGTQGN